MAATTTMTTTSVLEVIESEPVENLWSSILDSVSSTRTTPSKSVLILGEKSTGRSTIASGLLGRPLDSTSKENSDFALGFDWADIRDDSDEDTLARLSVYTVPSSAPSYLSLIPEFLPPRNSIPHTLVVIILDWTKPWTFVEQLELWLSWVEKWAKGDGSRELEIVREESRERLQSHLQHYTEPSAPGEANTSLAGPTLTGTLLPLGPGTLTHNSAGIPVIVVCTKADLIDEAQGHGHDSIIGGTGVGGMGGMIKGKGGEWEEKTDGIMQVLRTICLKYGAALFYTTTQPNTLSRLRQYILHLLFTPPMPSPSLPGADAPAPIRNPFPFSHRPNTLDRDCAMVPAGWDSWGKITVLREGFDAKAWGEAWESDLEQHEGEGNDGGIGAKEMFKLIVGVDESFKPNLLPPLISPTPEQQFLAAHYESNRDPRQTFRNPSDRDPSNISGAGVVGPLGSSSFNLPTVERALVEMEGGSGLGESSRGGDKERRPPTTKRDPIRPVPTLSSSGTSSTHAHTRPPASPNLPSAGGTGQTQHEVLQNFFQSLLSSRDRGASSNANAGAGSAGASSANGGGGSSQDAKN